MFDRFSRGIGTRGRTGSEGVGLGLSLVAEHVALHSGRVWVEDRPDGEPGARFVVELPVTLDMSAVRSARSALGAIVIATAVLGAGCGLSAEKHPHEISDRAITDLLNPASTTTTTPLVSER